MRKYIVILEDSVVEIYENYSKDKNDWGLSKSDPYLFDSYKEAYNMKRRVQTVNKGDDIKIFFIEVPVEIRDKIVVKYKIPKLTNDQKVEVYKSVVDVLSRNPSNAKGRVRLFNQYNINLDYDAAIQKLESGV